MNEFENKVAVITGGAGDYLLISYHLAHAQKRCLLLLGEGDEVLHILDVLLHHLEVAHTRQHHKDVVKARRKAYSVGGEASVAEGGGEALCLVRHIE